MISKPSTAENRPPGAPAPSETASARQRLRAETQDVHGALEDLLPITRRGDLETYRDHLRFLLSYHRPLERRLRAVDGLGQRVPDLDRRWKAPRLERDLADGAEAPRDVPDAPPDLLPDTGTAAEALGALYVLEGATLGARGLLQTLREEGVLPGEVGTAYLDSYGERHGAMWRSFCQGLESLDGDEVDAAVAAARATFEGLLAWRSRWEALDD